MSLPLLINDILHGNFKNAGARIKNWWSALSPSLQAFLTTVETDEGQILQGLVVVGAQDVIKGGLNTASFTAVIKDVGTKLAQQNITMANTVITTALNAEVSAQAAAAGIAVPTNAGVQVVAPVAVPAAPVS